MNSLTDYINERIYPELFNHIDMVFPDMRFVKSAKGWISPYKLDGAPSHDKRKDKTTITYKQPKRILEQGGDSMDLISFYQYHKGGNLSTIDTVKEIAGILNVDPPKGIDSKSYEEYKKKQNALENVIKKMKEALRSENGKKTLDYLRNERGYSDDIVNGAEFGYCSSVMAEDLRQIFTYQKDGSEICTLPYGVGDRYTLAIPYRTGGYVAGLVFRTLEEGANNSYPKYKDAFISENATKKYHLFGLTGLNLTGKPDKDRDITVVEGEIDALIANIKGLDNVCAASGGNISDEAIQEAKRRGVKRITILYDNDNTKDKTDEKIERAIETISHNGLYPLVATFPDNNGKKVDTDSYLKDHSIEELKTILNNAVSGTVFQFNRINEEAIREQDEDGIIHHRDLNEFKRKTIELSNRSTVLPTDRDIVFKMFFESTRDVITKEAIEEEANRLKGIEDKKIQRIDTLRTLSEAYTFANSDDPDGVNKALSLIGDKVSRLKEISREADYQKLLSLPSVETIKERFKDRPTGIPTNYYFGTGDKRERLLLQSGALTYICAPTSHGKSRMLENLAIQLSTDGESGDVIYFTFEEDTEAVRMQLLNVYIGEDLSKNNIRSLNSYYRDGKNYFYKDTYKQNLFKTKEADFMKIITSGKLRVFSEDYDSNDLIGSIRYLSRNIKIKAVFIDYIQLLHTRGAGAGRKEELADMCRGFMTLAKDTGLPIILAAQLNREAYSPIEMTAQNIAEASEIEHSANTIMVLWNSVNEPLQKSGYFYRDKTGNRPTEESSKLEKRGFNIGTEGKLYAKLVKNRAGARNIDAIFDFNGNSGKITQTDNDSKTFKEEEASSDSSEKAEDNKFEIF